MEALILADRLGEDLAPLDGYDCPALLPVAGKAVLEHCLEDLWEAGVRAATVAFPATHPHLPARIGDGSRFGIQLRYLQTTGESWPAEIISRAQLREDRVLLVRGDLMRGRSARLIRDAAARHPAGTVHGLIGRSHAGIAICSPGDRTASCLDWALLRESHLPAATPAIGIDHAGLSLMDSPTAWHRAGMLALAGRFRGILPAGRASDDGTLIRGPQSSIARSAVIEGQARIGSGASLRDDVVLAGHVDIGDGCVIDSGAEISDSLVLPGTYVGRGVRLRNAIACGSWLLRLDLGTSEQVDDPLLLDGLRGGRAQAASRPTASTPA